MKNFYNFLFSLSLESRWANRRTWKYWTYRTVTYPRESHMHTQSAHNDTWLRVARLRLVLLKTGLPGPGIIHLKLPAPLGNVNPLLWSAGQQCARQASVWDARGDGDDKLWRMGHLSGRQDGSSGQGWREVGHIIFYHFILLSDIIKGSYVNFRK